MPLSLKRLLLIAFIVAAVAVFCVALFHALVLSPSEDVSAYVPPSPVAIGPKELPDRLSIPKLGINAPVENVGIAKSGNMAVPRNYVDVGWYRGGTAPGQLGSAVIDGHVDNALSLDGVFKHLATLAVGDDIYVTTKEGSRLHFVVSDVETYAVADVPRELLFTRTDVPRLNLITCAGTWVQSNKSYDSRTVVYTTLVS